MKSKNKELKHRSKERPDRFKINPSNTFELIDYQIITEKSPGSEEKKHEASKK